MRAIQHSLLPLTSLRSCAAHTHTMTKTTPILLAEDALSVSLSQCAQLVQIIHQKSPYKHTTFTTYERSPATKIRQSFRIVSIEWMPLLRTTQHTQKKNSFYCVV